MYLQVQLDAIAIMPNSGWETIRGTVESLKQAFFIFFQARMNSFKTTIESTPLIHQT